jgi:mannitol/fructose-specific phosphotransferase system IIA component (Ntr-type)
VRLLDYLDLRHVLLDLKEPDRDAVLRRLVEALRGTDMVESTDGPLRLLVEREELMTTGIHPGVAVPHAYTHEVPQTVCSFARLANGVDWKSLDGSPTSLVFCLLGPPEATETHLKLLARIAKLIDLPGAMDDLRMAATPDSLLSLLRAAEKRMH